MIGLIFLYFIGKAFYDLADQYDKSKWGFAILGVVSYYAGYILGCALLGIFIAFVLSQSLDDMNEYALSFLALPVGVLSCWGFYRILKSQWSRSLTASSRAEVLDGDLINPQL
jgi:hypothetical protein